MKARLMILALVSFLLTGPAMAQHEWSSPVATFDAPFDFVVTGTTLPAGHYSVRTSGTGHLMMIQNTETHQTVIAMNHHIPLVPNSSHENTKAVFVPSYDGRHVLHQLSIVGDDHTHDLIHDSSVLELVAAR